MTPNAWLATRRAEIEEHRWRPPELKEVETPTLREYAETWIQNRRTRDGQPLKPRTMDLYHALLEKQIYPGDQDAEVPSRSPHCRAGCESLCPETRRGGFGSGEAVAFPSKGAFDLSNGEIERPLAVRAGLLAGLGHAGVRVTSGRSLGNVPSGDR